MHVCFGDAMGRIGRRKHSVRRSCELDRQCGMTAAPDQRGFASEASWRGESVCGVGDEARE
jgi:hypothetical protein